MIRNLKVLGLALVAVFALSAVAASMASAQQGKLTTDGTSVTIDGVEDGKNSFAYPGVEGEVECPGSPIVGHEWATHEQTTTREAMGETKHLPVPLNATTVTITPEFKNCKAAGHFVTVTMNGCDFDFKIGLTTSGVTDTYALTADVICPPGKQIEVHVYLNATESKTPLCTIFVPAQAGIAGFDIANEIEGGKTNDTLTATGKSAKIKASRTGLCGANETEKAEQTINYTLTGTNSLGAKTGITITDA